MPTSGFAGGSYPHELCTFFKLKELIETKPVCEEGVLYDQLCEVVPHEVLLQLGLVPGVLPAQELQETLDNLNFFNLLVGPEVVLRLVVFQVN